MNAFSEGEIMSYHDFMLRHEDSKAGRPSKVSH